MSFLHQILRFLQLFTFFLQPKEVQESSSTENTWRHSQWDAVHLQHLWNLVEHETHVKDAHGKWKKWKCLVSYWNLALQVVHSDHKKYKCQYCGSSFKRSKALKNHLILHSGLRPYACPWCDKTFANGSNCRSHKKKAHPNELAVLEASGKTSNAAPNIPRLEQLQPKSQQQLMAVDGNDVISGDIKQELPSLHITRNVDAFQVQTNSPMLGGQLSQWPRIKKLSA